LILRPKTVPLLRTAGNAFEEFEAKESVDMKQCRTDTAPRALICTSCNALNIFSGHPGSSA
jgi:hypothetical protein